MNKKNFAKLGLFLASFALAGSLYATADTLRVVRDGIAIQTPSPILTNLTVEGTMTGPFTIVTTNNLAITKATPVISAIANTNTAASVVVDGGSSSDASVIFKSNGTAKWALGNDSSATDGFAISTAGALGTTDRLRFTSAGAATLTGATTITGAATLSSTLGVTGTSTLAAVNATAGTFSSTLEVTGATTQTGALTLGAALLPKVTTLADGGVTVNAALGNVFLTQSNTGATAITTISNPTVGQIIHIVGGSATNSSTIADSGSFKLTAAMTLGLNDSITILIQASNAWVELARADN